MKEDAQVEPSPPKFESKVVVSEVSPDVPQLPSPSRPRRPISPVLEQKGDDSEASEQEGEESSEESDESENEGWTGSEVCGCYSMTEHCSCFHQSPNPDWH